MPFGKNISQLEAGGKTCNIYFWADNIEALYKEFIAKGNSFDWDLCIQPYGLKEFGITDPDVYYIGFGQIL